MPAISFYGFPITYPNGPAHQLYEEGYVTKLWERTSHPEMRSPSSTINDIKTVLKKVRNLLASKG
jgi:hypothetical protein